MKLSLMSWRNKNVNSLIMVVTATVMVTVTAMHTALAMAAAAAPTVMAMAETIGPVASDDPLATAALVVLAAATVEERITIMVTERRTAVAREGFFTLFNFFLSLYSFQRGRNLLVACMCTCSFIHPFIRHAPRTTYNEDPTPIHIKKK